MKRYFKSSISAMAMSALVMGGVAATVSLSAVPAFSKSENGNDGNRGGNRGGRENGNRGALTSSMGALNAAHANAIARENASANSRVGMIEVYKMAVVASAEADAALAYFYSICGELANDVISAPLSTGCTNFLTEEALQLKVADLDYASYLTILKSNVTKAGDFENEALELAANKETNDDVIEALWDLLDLEGFEPTEEVE